MIQKINLKAASLLVFLFTLVVTQLNAAALTATAPSINVLELPTPQISDIDSTTGIVTLSPPELDPEVSAELQAIIQLYDGDTLLETAKVSIIDRTASIKIPLKTPLKTGFRVVPKFINHEIISGGADDSVSEKAPPPEPPPPEPAPTPAPAPTVIYESGSGGGRGETVYVVKDAKPKTVVVEKIVEVAKTVYVDAPINNNMSTDSSEDTGGLEQNMISVKPSSIDYVELKAPASNVSVNSKNKIQMREYLILTSIVMLLCALLAWIILITRYNYYPEEENKHIAIEPANLPKLVAYHSEDNSEISQ